MVMVRVRAMVRVMVMVRGNAPARRPGGALHKRKVLFNFRQKKEERPKPLPSSFRVELQLSRCPSCARRSARRRCPPACRSACSCSSHRKADKTNEFQNFLSCSLPSMYCTIRLVCRNSNRQIYDNGLQIKTNLIIAYGSSSKTNFAPQ